MRKFLDTVTRFQKHKGIPWKAIAGMRDIFAHHYGSIDYEMTWNTSIEDIKMLKEFLENC